MQKGSDFFFSTDVEDVFSPAGTFKGYAGVIRLGKQQVWIGNRRHKDARSAVEEAEERLFKCMANLIEDTPGAFRTDRFTPGLLASS